MRQVVVRCAADKIIETCGKKIISRTLLHQFTQMITVTMNETKAANIDNANVFVPSFSSSPAIL